MQLYESSALTGFQLAAAHPRKNYFFCAAAFVCQQPRKNSPEYDLAVELRFSRAL
jgi:hypothetical protein